MSKGIVVRLSDLKRKSCRVQCFNKHMWNVRKGIAYRVVPAGSPGDEVELYDVPVEKIFNQIKFIWFRGQLAAIWNGEEVVTTGDNSFLVVRSKKSESIQSEINKQALRDALAYNEWQKSIVNFWHNDSPVKKDIDEKYRERKIQLLAQRKQKKRKRLLKQSMKAYCELEKREFNSWLTSIQDFWHRHKDQYY